MKINTEAKSPESVEENEILLQQKNDGPSDCNERNSSDLKNELFKKKEEARKQECLSLTRRLLISFVIFGLFGNVEKVLEALAVPYLENSKSDPIANSEVMSERLSWLLKEALKSALCFGAVTFGKCRAQKCFRKIFPIHNGKMGKTVPILPQYRLFTFAALEDIVGVLSLASVFSGFLSMTNQGRTSETGIATSETNTHGTSETKTFTLLHGAIIVKIFKQLIMTLDINIIQTGRWYLAVCGMVELEEIDSTTVAVASWKIWTQEISLVLRAFFGDEKALLKGIDLNVDDNQKKGLDSNFESQDNDSDLKSEKEDADERKQAKRILAEFDDWNLPRKTNEDCDATTSSTNLHNDNHTTMTMWSLLKAKRTGATSRAVDEGISIEKNNSREIITTVNEALEEVALAQAMRLSRQRRKIRKRKGIRGKLVSPTVKAVAPVEITVSPTASDTVKSADKFGERASSSGREMETASSSHHDDGKSEQLRKADLCKFLTEVQEQTTKKRVALRKRWGWKWLRFESSETGSRWIGDFLIVFAEDFFNFFNFLFAKSTTFANGNTIVPAKENTQIFATHSSLTPAISSLACFIIPTSLLFCCLRRQQKQEMRKVTICGEHMTKFYGTKDGISPHLSFVSFLMMGFINWLTFMIKLFIYHPPIPNFSGFQNNGFLHLVFGGTGSGGSIGSENTIGGGNYTIGDTGSIGNTSIDTNRSTTSHGNAGIQFGVDDHSHHRRVLNSDPVQVPIFDKGRAILSLTTRLGIKLCVFLYAVRRWNQALIERERKEMEGERDTEGSEDRNLNAAKNLLKKVLTEPVLGPGRYKNINKQPRKATGPSIADSKGRDSASDNSAMTGEARINEQDEARINEIRLLLQGRFELPGFGADFKGLLKLMRSSLCGCGKGH